MKRLFCLSVIVLFSSCIAQKKTKLEFTYTKPYCGGARPTKEMEAEAMVPYPYANKKFIFVNELGKADSASTDSNGNLFLKLKPGAYKIYEPWKFYKRTPTGEALKLYDPDCLKLEWEKEIYIVKINKKSTQIIKRYDLLEKCPHQIECYLNVNMPE